MFNNFLIVYDYDNHKTVIKLKDGYTTNDIEKIVVSIFSGDETGEIVYKDGTEQQFDAFTNSRRYQNFFDGEYTVEDIPLWLNFEPNEDDPFDTFAYQRQRYYEDKIAEKIS